MEYLKVSSFDYDHDGLVCKDDIGGVGYALWLDKGGSTSTGTAKFAPRRYDTEIAESGSLSINTWYHIVGTHESGSVDENKIYIDGVLSATVSDTNPMVANNEPLHIGRQFGHNSYNLNGFIDEVSIFNKVVSVSSLRDGTKPSDLTGLSGMVGWWRMGDGTLDSFPIIADQVNPTLGANIIPNTSFESNTTGWSSVASSTLSYESGGQSGNCLKILEQGGNHYPGAKTGELTVTAETLYKLSFYHKDIDSTGDTFNYGFYDATGASYFNVDGTTAGAPSMAQVSTTSSSTWVKEELYFKTPVDCILFVVFLRSGATASSGNAFYIDEVFLNPFNGNAGLMIDMDAVDIVKDTP